MGKLYSVKNMIKFDRIKEIRKDKDITQEHIANYLNIKSKTYSKYETNVNIPSLEVIYNISKLFELNIDYVVGLTDKRIKTNYNDYDKKLIANNLRALRDSKKLSRQQLAIKLGITQSCIHRYENALSNPSLPIAYKYTKIFNISFYDLCTKQLNNI